MHTEYFICRKILNICQKDHCALYLCGTDGQISMQLINDIYNFIIKF